MKRTLMVVGGLALTLGLAAPAAGTIHPTDRYRSSFQMRAECSAAGFWGVIGGQWRTYTCRHNNDTDRWDLWA